MKQLFAYIRVSTAKQGQGVSLQEQRAAIERYATRTSAQITQWFEERKTAAKAGRPEFSRMLGLLRAGKAQGVVIHKIDRSTRNYRDWAEIDEVLESGIDVFFANEDVDLRSRGGRLAADIQMVVAVDYIRNLREEALKGIHGRLKQGILPHGAPIGYLDRGAGQPKAIDSLRGPIIRKLFDEYSTGQLTLRELTSRAEALGLRNRNGNPLRLSQIHKIVRNPFYCGMIRSRRHGLFAGAHEPLVNRVIFDRVQDVLDGKRVRCTNRFDFPFRRLIHCKTCGRSLVGSQRKGFVYYRCQTIDCPTTSLREDVIDEEILAMLRRITFEPHELEEFETEIHKLFADGEKFQAARQKALSEALEALNARLGRLTDLLIDGTIDSSTHDEKRASLLAERARLEDDQAAVATGKDVIRSRVEKILGLLRSASFLYESANADRRRQIIEIAFSDCTATGKTVEFSLREPFAKLAKSRPEQSCGPHWYTARTFDVKEVHAWGSDWKSDLWKHLQDIFENENVQTSAPAA